MELNNLVKLEKLMENKYLNLEYIDFDNIKMRNITMHRILPWIPSEFKNGVDIDYFQVQDDQLLEKICFDIYNTTDYWDILMALNDMDHMDCLPVNSDILLDRIEFKLKEWKYNKTFNKHLPDDEMLKEQRELIVEEEEYKNEKFRYIKYLNNNQLPKLMTYLASRKGKPNIKPELIINPPKDK